MRLLAQLDVALKDIRRRGLTPAGVYLAPDDLSEMIEDLDAGDPRLSDDGKFEGLPVSETGGKSYVQHERGAYFLHMAGHPTLMAYRQA